MPARRILAILWTLAAFLLMLWSWAFYAGPYRWAAEWQLDHFGSYGTKVTLFVPLIILMLPAALIGGRGPLIPPPATPEARLATARRTARVLVALGVASLAVGAAGGGLGHRRMQTPPTRAAFDLTTGTETLPDADLVTVSGVARTDLIVGFRETTGGVAHAWTFVPLVAPSWSRGDPIRLLLKTNQTVIMPRAGEGGSGLPRMLRRDAPPFRMMTEPSVPSRYALPGLVRTEYEKARIPLDPAVVVLEQSPSEVYAPYWMTAALGGIAGLCLLLGGALGGINARRAAKRG